MICRMFLTVVLFVSGPGFAGPRINETVKGIRTLSKTEDYAKALRLLGTPDSLIAKYSMPEYAGALELMEKPGAEYPLLTKAHFVRAETFRENVDGDPAKEYVSQVLFATGSEKLDRKIYFVFVHDDDANGDRLVRFALFDELLCDHTPASPMTFSFLRKGNSGPAAIEFKIVRTISCGDDIDYFTVNDTMAYDGKTVDYRRGAPRDSVHINRSKELKDFNPLEE